MRSRRDGALFENLFAAWGLYFFALAPPALGGIKATSDMSDTTAAAPSRESRPSLELLDHLVQEVETVFHGKREVIRLALAALLARGHVLFEDVPGVGKTTLSHALARTLGLGFRRILVPERTETDVDVPSNCELVRVKDIADAVGWLRTPS